jgi:DNA-binding GntR family transcriptional regulator
MKLPPLNILNTNSLADGLYDALKEAIIQGKLKSGDKLTELTIAAHVNISRTPVRQALHRLLNEGMLEQNGRSLVVSRVSIETLSELCVIRETLEGLAARLAAINRSESDILSLESLTNDFEMSMNDGNTEEIIKNNYYFHFVIWEASQNQYLKNELSVLGESIQRMQISTLHSIDRQSETLKEHRALLEAIKNSDAEAAESITREHFRKAEAIRLTMLRMKALKNSKS